MSGSSSGNRRTGIRRDEKRRMPVCPVVTEAESGPEEVDQVRMSCRMLVWIMTAASLASVPSPSFAGSIVGTAHNLSGRGWGTNEICIFCHTPHNAKSAQLAPLWNHASTTATYTLYSSSTMDVPVGQPGNASKTCLSCHDGTVAMDAYGNSAGSNFMPGVPGTPGSRNLGSNLSDDHPVGIAWQHQTSGGSNSNCMTCHDLFADPPQPRSSWGKELRFFDGKVECGSCHNAHSNDLTKFLRKTIAASALCIHCHQTK